LIHVALEATATAADVAEVRALFAAEGIEAEIAADYGRKSELEGLAWSVFILVPIGAVAKGFFEQLGKQGADAAKPHLAKMARIAAGFFGELWRSRTRHAGDNGAIIIVPGKPRVWVLVEQDDVPERGYLALFTDDLEALAPRSGTLRYDRTTGTWRDAVEMAPRLPTLNEHL
jgi:hypothetical protein